MQARVDVLVPYGQAETAIHTFHAFGDRVLREFGHELGYAEAPRVIGRAEAVVLLRANLFELGLERYRPLSDPTRFLGSLVDLFGRAKDEGIEPSHLAAFAAELTAGARTVLDAAIEPGERDLALGLLDEASAQAELAAAYGRYQGLLAERGLVDFGDQIAVALRLVRQRALVRVALVGRYRYVLVDEAQDADAHQMELVREVAGRGNLTIVGDDDQAIYAFRGAAVANLRGLSTTYPKLRHIVLRHNHRSRAPIIVAAQRLISHNDPFRLAALPGLDLQPVARRRGPRAAAVRALAYASVAEEADAVAGEIATRVEAGARPQDFAVLVRTNADAAPVLRSLDLRGVPARSGGRSGIMTRPEVRELLAFLRAVVEPNGSTDLYAIATAEPYQLGGEDLTAILELAHRRHRSLWSVLVELTEQPGMLRLGAATRRAVEHVVAELRTAMADSHERPATEVLYAHLRRTDKYRVLVAAAEHGDDAPLRRVARLFELLAQQSALVDDPRLTVVVPHLQALLEAGEDPVAADPDPDENVVRVLTVHKAKGLEFPVVFLLGMAEGRFPARGRRDRLALPEALLPAASDDEAPWAEERRLCYVAMTRARDELVMSYSGESAAGGRHRRPSPFLAEALDRPAPLPATSLPTARARIEGAAPAHEIRGLSGLPAAVTAPSMGPLTLSHSQVDDYLTCPLKYRLRHLARVPTPPHHALVVGNALHQAVAAFHLAQQRGRPMGEAGILEAFAAHWSNEGFLSRHHEEARFAAGQDALRRFVADQKAPSERVTVGVERPFSVRLGADTVRGRYDRVDDSPQGAIITDYKSSDVRDPDKARERARDSLQLQLYALAHEAETGELPAALELHFLESGLVGRVEPDQARLAKARASLTKAADGIRGGRFPARPDMVSCGYCPYRDICPSSAA
jgi:DNA helicase-2/ATP-dependent DNA helicase PcrA